MFDFILGLTDHTVFKYKTLRTAYEISRRKTLDVMPCAVTVIRLTSPFPADTLGIRCRVAG